MEPTPDMLAKLSPHRAHESNWLKSVLCHLGLHRWYEVKFDSKMPAVDFCYWCSKVRPRG